jgi:hypothetical protein
MVYRPSDVRAPPNEVPRTKFGGVLGFLIEMAENPLALEEFRAGSERVLSAWALSDAENDAIRSRNQNRIGALFSQASRNAV